jgi:hypothetical protein
MPLEMIRRSGDWDGLWDLAALPRHDAPDGSIHDAPLGRREDAELYLRCEKQFTGLFFSSAFPGCAVRSSIPTRHAPAAGARYVLVAAAYQI